MHCQSKGPRRPQSRLAVASKSRWTCRTANARIYHFVVVELSAVANALLFAGHLGDKAARAMLGSAVIDSHNRYDVWLGQPRAILEIVYRHLDPIVLGRSRGKRIVLARAARGR